MRTKKLTITISRRDTLAGAVAFISHHPVVGPMPACGETMLIEGLQSASATQFEPCPREGFARRLMFNCCNNDLQAGRTESSFLINGKRLGEDEMRRLTAYAKRHRFLR
jgi:hypothetical protein